MDESSQDKAPWAFDEEDGTLEQTEPTLAATTSEPVRWTASEYLAHEKSTGWYVGLAVVTVVVSGLVYMISSGDFLSIGVIVVVAILFGILAGKTPRELSYVVDEQGLTIGGKVYPYELFKSFSVLREGPLTSINLFPLRRFMPDLSIYLPPAEEDRILAALSDHLPHHQRAEHVVDRLMKRVRF